MQFLPYGQTGDLGVGSKGQISSKAWGFAMTRAVDCSLQLPLWFNQHGQIG